MHLQIWVRAAVLNLRPIPPVTPGRLRRGRLLFEKYRFRVKAPPPAWAVPTQGWGRPARRVWAGDSPLAFRATSLPCPPSRAARQSLSFIHWTSASASLGPRPGLVMTSTARPASHSGG